MKHIRQLTILDSEEQVVAEFNVCKPHRGERGAILEGPNGERIYDSVNEALAEMYQQAFKLVMHDHSELFFQEYES